MPPMTTRLVLKSIAHECSGCEWMSSEDNCGSCGMMFCSECLVLRALACFPALSEEKLCKVCSRRAIEGDPDIPLPGRESVCNEGETSSTSTEHELGTLTVATSHLKARMSPSVLLSPIESHPEIQRIMFSRTTLTDEDDQGSNLFGLRIKVDIPSPRPPVRAVMSEVVPSEHIDGDGPDLVRDEHYQAALCRLRQDLVLALGGLSGVGVSPLRKCIDRGDAPTADMVIAAVNALANRSSLVQVSVISGAVCIAAVVWSVLSHA